MSDPALRLCTWNVHGWCDAAGEPADELIVADLRAMDSDLVALQEVPDAVTLARLAGRLGYAHAFAPADYAGNALLSRRSWGEVRSLELGGGEMRSAVSARVDLGGVAVWILATHLDVHEEAQRCAQYARLVAALPRAEPAIVLGDFNALRGSDYDPRRRAEIDARRRLARVEARSDALMNRLDGDGWFDLVRLALARGDTRGYAASLQEPLPAPLAATSRFDTRVDYLFGNTALLERFVARHPRVGDGRASDHRPVLLDLLPRALTAL